MRSKLLITSAAALLAGTMLAAGQGTTERKDQPQSGGAGINQPQPKGVQNEKGVQSKGAQSEPRQTQGKDAQKEPSRPSTAGQAPRGEEQNRSQGQDQRNQEQNRPQGQAQPQREQEQNRIQGQAPNQREPQGQREQQGQREGGGTSVTLTTEQRTKIRETVLRGSNAPRVSSVNFSVNVGTVIPRTVRVIEVPETIVEIHPEWRAYRYFVYNDEIIIVEPNTLRIVAVLTV
jgi:hypothetical protein